MVDLGIGQQWRIHLGFERAGADAVHGDALGGHFERQRARQSHQAGLAGAVGRPLGERDVAHHRSQVEDPAVAVSLHQGHKGTARQEHAGEVGVHHVAPLFEREVGQFLPQVDAGAVDQDVDSAEAGRDSPGEGGHLSLVPDVRGERFGFGAAGCEGGGGLLELTAVARHQRQAGAGSGQFQRNRLAEPFTGARDHRHATLQPGHAGSCFCFAAGPCASRMASTTRCGWSMFAISSTPASPAVSIVTSPMPTIRCANVCSARTS